MENTKDFLEIEDLVQKRKTAAARLKIRAFLRENSQGHPALLRACDWYRRLGLFREGFLLVAPREPLQRRTSASEPEGERLLWVIQFLNLLGASEFALRLASLLEVTDPEAHRVLGAVYLANFDHASARPHFEAVRRLRADTESYRYRIGLLDLADTYSGLGRYGEAVEIARDVVQWSSETLLRAISLSAWGEYLARQERIPEAWARLQESEALFSPEDQTPDRGVLAKWSAYVQARLGRVEEAMAEFERALRILQKPAIRPEAWLDVYRLKDSLGWLSRHERERLLHYPGLAPGFRKLLPTATEATVFGVTNPRGAPALELDLTSDEYRLGTDRYLGIPAELRLLAAVAVSGEWGLSLARAETVLWPNEVFSYTQLRRRLHAMLERLRGHYGVEIQLEDGLLRLGRNEVRVIAGPARPPALVREGSSLTTRRMRQFYRMGPRQAQYRLKSLRAWPADGATAVPERAGGSGGGQL